MLMTIVASILTATALIVCVPVAVLFLEVVAATALSNRGRSDRDPHLPRPRIAVLIPAHDESVGISATIEDVLVQINTGDRVLVVADNCSDDTAEIARSLGADVIETIAPPPEGDNQLCESRRSIDTGICTKGNLSLGLLREGSPDDVAGATRNIVRAVDGYSHIFSTADGVLQNTPPENYLTFVQTVREMIC